MKFKEKYLCTGRDLCICLLVACLHSAAFSQQSQNIGDKMAGSDDELSLNIEPVELGRPIFATSEMIEMQENM